MFTIMGATGRVGGQIAARLLRAGEPVRAVGRSKEKLAGLAAAGAEVKVGDAGNASFLADSFRASEGIFTMMPYDLAAPDFHAQQRSYGEAIAQAVRDSGVHHVVALSSVGAELAAGNGPIACLHDQERRLGAIDGVHLLFLRAAYFFENFADAMPMIREQGVVADAYAPDVLLPMVATADIAGVATQALRLRDWKGTVVREVLGPRELSYAEATRIIGERIGRPDLPYVQMEYAAWADVLVAAGMSPSVAEVLADLARAINEGTVRATAAGDHASSMTSRFEDYAERLVSA